MNWGHCCMDVDERGECKNKAVDLADDLHPYHHLWSQDGDRKSKIVDTNGRNQLSLKCGWPHSGVFLYLLANLCGSIYLDIFQYNLYNLYPKHTPC